MLTTMKTEKTTMITFEELFEFVMQIFKLNGINDSQAEIAKRLNYNKSTISRLKTGQTPNPPFSVTEFYEKLFAPSIYKKKEKTLLSELKGIITNKKCDGLLRELWDKKYKPFVNELFELASINQATKHEEFVAAKKKTTSHSSDKPIHKEENDQSDKPIHKEKSDQSDNTKIRVDSIPNTPKHNYINPEIRMVFKKIFKFHFIDSGCGNSVSDVFDMNKTEYTALGDNLKSAILLFLNEINNEIIIKHREDLCNDHIFNILNGFVYKEIKSFQCLLAEYFSASLKKESSLESQNKENQCNEKILDEQIKCCIMSINSKYDEIIKYNPILNKLYDDMLKPKRRKKNTSKHTRSVLDMINSSTKKKK